MQPNRSLHRSRILVMRCCQVSAPANSKAFSATETVDRAQPALAAMDSYLREARAGSAVVKAP